MTWATSVQKVRASQLQLKMGHAIASCDVFVSLIKQYLHVETLGRHDASGIK